MKQLMMGFAACALLLTGCTEQDITERVIDGQGQLIFSTGVGKQATKAAELTNTELRAKAVVGNEIVLYAYKDTVVQAVNQYTKWFADELWHNGSEWKIGSTRFRNTVKTKFVTYYPQTGRLKEVDDAGKSSFLTANFNDKKPAFTYQVNTTSINQEDLIAGITDVAANQTDITIGLRHILSQVNFGTRGYNGANIAIQNIQIKGLYNSATYTYRTADTYPIGDWDQAGTNGTGNSRTATYEYYKYSNESATSNPQPIVTHTAVKDDIYVFGDGGMWGPGKSTSTFYPNRANGAWANYNATTPQDSLTNSLMLMPQDFANDPNAKVTFEYKITDKDGAYVAGNKDTWEFGEFKLDFETGSTLGTHYMARWDQNYRYLYLIDFTDFLDGIALTFKVDVEMHKWENHNNGNGDDGIINIMAAGQPSAKNMNDAKFVNGTTWYIATQSDKDPIASDPQKWAQVIKDEIWDLSTYDFTQIAQSQTFNLNFRHVIFNTKEVNQNSIPTNITLTLPDGFSTVTKTASIKVSDPILPNTWTISEGDTTAAAFITITNNNYYRTAEALKTGIEAAGVLTKTKFGYGGTKAVDLTTMEPNLTTVDNTITVKFNSLVIPTVGATSKGIWTWNATTKTATWTNLDWNSQTLVAAKNAISGATADAIIYCSDVTEIASLATTFGEPTNVTGVSTIKVVFNNATADRTGAGTDNGVWTYSPASKTATWTKNPPAPQP